MLTFLVVMAVLGLLSGAVARLLVPGRDDIGVLGTIGLGIAGSFIGGFLGYIIFHHDVGQGAVQPSGVIGSVVGAILLLLARRRFGSRTYARR